MVRDGLNLTSYMQVNFTLNLIEDVKIDKKNLSLSVRGFVVLGALCECSHYMVK